MIKYTLSPIIKAFKPSGNYHMALFGERISGNMGPDNILYTVKTIDEDIPVLYEGKQVDRIHYIKQYNATMALQVGTRFIWLDDMSNVVGDTPRPIKERQASAYNAIFGKQMEITRNEQYLICEDVVCDGSFDNKILIKDVQGGSYFNEYFIVRTPKQLFDVTNRVIAWVNPDCLTVDGKHTGSTINAFVDGFVIIEVPGNSPTFKYTRLELKKKICIVQQNTCIKCNVKPKRFMTYGCGHSVVCESCHDRLKTFGDAKICPVCSAPIEIAIKTVPR